MTLVELKQILKAAGFPVAYSHFTQTPEKPVPSPPYICYLVDSNPNFKADNKVYHKITDVNIELYTDKKDSAAEAKVEAVLDANEIPYDSMEAWIESENLYQKLYEVRLI